MKLCLFCKHFEFEGESPGYSELTPGSPMDIGCCHPNLYWDRMISPTVYRSWTEGAVTLDLRNKMRLAETCPDFEPVDEH